MLSRLLVLNATILNGFNSDSLLSPKSKEPVPLGAGYIYSTSCREGVFSETASFRCTEFSETQFVPLLILVNPIYRGSSIKSGPGLRARDSAKEHSRKLGSPYARRLLGSCAPTAMRPQCVPQRHPH